MSAAEALLTEQLAQSRQETVAAREEGSAKLHTSYVTINNLRRQLAEAQELNEQTQSMDARADLRKLKPQLEEAKKTSASRQEELVQVRGQLEACQKQVQCLQGQLAAVLSAPSARTSLAASSASTVTLQEHNNALAAVRAEHEKDRRHWRKFKKWMKMHHPELIASPSSTAQKASSPKVSQQPPSQPIVQNVVPAQQRVDVTPVVTVKMETSSPLPLPPPGPAVAPVAGPSKMTPSPLRLSPSRRSSSVSARGSPTPRNVMPVYAELGEPPLPAARWQDIDNARFPPSSGKRKRVLKSDDEAREAADEQDAKRRRRVSEGKSTRHSEGAKAKETSAKKRAEPEELHPGQNFLDEVRRKRKEAVMADPGRWKIKKNANADTPRPSRTEYEIDPDRNDGRDYAFHEVVRSRDERKKLHAADCECCSDYYMKANDNDAARAQAHRQAISRHRSHWQPPASPPQYWQMGFPSTAQVEDINREAEEMRIEKERKIAADIELGQGRYRRKQ